MKTTQRMRFLIGALAACNWICATPSRAQNEPDSMAPASAVLQIGSKELASLETLARRKDVGAVSLNTVTKADLQAKPAAWRALSQWVREGGIVLLHTDAARLFGYETVAARERTKERA